MTDKKTLDLAREWAEHHAHTELVLDAAAAEVITALPDTIVDGDKLREVINAQLDSHPHGTVGHYVAQELACKLQDLLPAPALPTLADMSPEERLACQWRMVDTPEGEGVYLKQHMSDVAVIYPSGRRAFWKLEEVVPLLDRPGMVWPGNEPEGGKLTVDDMWDDSGCPLEDLIELGEKLLEAEDRESASPRPEDVPVGEAWQVEAWGARGNWLPQPPGGESLLDGCVPGRC